MEAFQREMEDMMHFLEDDTRKDFMKRFRKIFHED
jgi:hypothetical protein